MYTSIYIIGHFEMAAAIERTSEACNACIYVYMPVYMYMYVYIYIYIIYI